MRVSHTGVSGLELLSIMFIYLKLTDQIDWSWLWVVAPFWISWVTAFFLIFSKGVATAMAKRKAAR